MDRGELLKQAKLFQIIDMYSSSNIYHDRTNLEGKKQMEIKITSSVLTRREQNGIQHGQDWSSLYEPKNSHAITYLHDFCTQGTY